MEQWGAFWLNEHAMVFNFPNEFSLNIMEIVISTAAMAVEAAMLVVGPCFFIKSSCATASLFLGLLNNERMYMLTNSIFMFCTNKSLLSDGFMRSILFNFVNSLFHFVIALYR